VAVSGAQVTISGENGFSAVTSSDGLGHFALGGVPAGGISVKADAAGYLPTTERVFASSVFSSPSGGAENLTLWLTPGRATNGTNGTVNEVSPFPDLETFVASVWSATALLAIAAAVAGIGSYAAYRRSHPAFAVAGGSAAALAPIALVILGLFSMFYLATAAAAVASAIGVFAGSALAIGMARSGASAMDDD
jgi:hypothetical protein